MSMVFTGASVLLDTELIDTTVTVSDGRIAAVGADVANGQRVDARGAILAPAMIDLHGDGFERQLMPRPGVDFPLDAALIDTDRQLGANGIATAYHALTLGWEPGLRSLAQAERVLSGLERLAVRFGVEYRVQLRWETFAFDAVPLVERALDAPLPPTIAFNDHVSMKMRSFDVAVQDRVFEQRSDFEVADPNDPRLADRVAGPARRSGLRAEEYIARLTDIWRRRHDVPAAIERVAALGRAAGVAMLSHDDTASETRDWYRGRGVRISEFPMQTAVAAAARAAGDTIVFGAPNVVRGSSHLGSPSAADMIEAGLCDALASDYFYPAMLAAIARLHAEGRRPLTELWRLVAANPARMAGLHDRGRIAVGQRADLVLIDWPRGEAPAVLMTMSDGRIASYRDGRSVPGLASATGLR